MAMTKAEAEGVARLFLTDYPGALELATSSATTRPSFTGRVPWKCPRT